MTVQNAAPQDYILPNYYTFNKGEPFYVEKDPLTGIIDFNKRTTPKSAERIESNTSSGLNDDRRPGEPESDYFYDEGEFDEGAIDRKDGNIEAPNAYRPNDIFQNPYKISPDLHQFLNLPVHYSSSDKFPLISSSYANTKIQGTGGSSSSYSNHKYTPTSSTQSPSYYTMPTTKYTTVKPQYQSTTTRTTTPTPSTKPFSSTTTEAEEYENTDYGDYEEEDSNTASDNKAVPSQYHTYKPDTTKYTVTTYRPSTYKYTTPIVSTKQTTTTTTTTEKPKQQVSIVTSLPLDMYYSSSQETTKNEASSSTSSAPFTTTVNLTNSEMSYNMKTSTETNKLSNQPQYNIPSENVYGGFGEEPFRPIFGLDSNTKQDSDINVQYGNSENVKTNPNPANEFHRLPPHQNIPYIQRPNPTLTPQMEPPRPDASHSFFPDQPIKLIPGQHASISFGDSASSNTISRPIQTNTYERPHPPASYNQELNSPSSFNQQASVSSQSKPIFEQKPSEKPTQPTKQNPVQEYPVKSNFKMPSKVENHFIKVSSDQDNPSYSLQTSFSIGVPSSGEKEQPEIKPGQGVGQVLFPDNTPAENTPIETNVNANLPSPVLRPPNNRAPIQAYQPNRPGYRQPIHVQGRPPPYRVPNDDLQPPSGEPDNYPRPHWEHHNKPFYGPAQNSIPKKDIILPQGYPGLSRGKPDKIQRPDLPNILPQFRPNAKQDYHLPSFGERLREPMDTLQPPPLPQPMHLRINRNDDEIDVEREDPIGEIPSDPLVHRRSGPQPSRVTTLQMMQQNPPRKPALRTDFSLDNRQTPPEKDKPVFLVYPSAHGMNHKSPPEEVVVIGTRAQRPLPPNNLVDKEDLDSFPLDDNKQFPIPGRDREDTPILKTKVSPKIPVKNDFPYPIVKPFTNVGAEERILSAATNVKEYTEYSPTPASSTEENRDHDSEINIIPYLQDYMPFAIKKPLLPSKPSTNLKKDKLPLKPPQPISATLDASLATIPGKTTTEKSSVDRRTELDKNDSEMTLSATIYTQPKPTNHKVPVTYTPSEPQPLGFQAPFMASLSAPESQGWSVVTDKNLKPAVEVSGETKEAETDDSKFDIENFKPQLFGGFQPILPGSEEDSVGAASTSEKNKDVLLNKGDREE